MPNVTNHFRNVIQNHNEILPHTHKTKQNKNKKVTGVGKDEEKLESLYMIDGNVKWCSHYEKWYKFLKKL